MRTFDGDGDVREGNVLEDESAGGVGTTGSGPGGGNGDGGVGEGTIKDDDGAGFYLAAAGGDVNADATVVNGEARICPAPVPQMIDGLGGSADYIKM